jgi:hypothetical protein
VNDNINMDSTITGSVDDNINMDSTTAESMPKINIPGTKISEIKNLKIYRCYKIKQELPTLPEHLSSPQFLVGFVSW